MKGTQGQTGANCVPTHSQIYWGMSDTQRTQKEKVYNLVSLDTCTYSGYSHRDQGNKYIHLLQTSVCVYACAHVCVHPWAHAHALRTFSLRFSLLTGCKCLLTPMALYIVGPGLCNSNPHSQKPTPIICFYVWTTVDVPSERTPVLLWLTSFLACLPYLWAQWWNRTSFEFLLIKPVFMIVWNVLW